MIEHQGLISAKKSVERFQENNKESFTAEQVVIVGLYGFAIGCIVTLILS